MIVKEVNKFMALMPLMLPKLIDSKQCVEPDIAEDSAVLYFNLEERFPIGMVMDMIDDDLDLLLLYHGTKKSEPRILHCCFFASPKLGKSMFKINLLTAADGFVDSVAVTIYDSGCLRRGTRQRPSCPHAVLRLHRGHDQPGTVFRILQDEL